MEPRWLSGHTGLQTTLLLSWVAFVYGSQSAVLRFSHFQGIKGLSLVECTLSDASDQFEINLRDGRTGEELASLNYESEECITSGVFASCSFGDGDDDSVVALRAVITDLQKGEKRPYVCKTFFEDSGQTVTAEYFTNSTLTADGLATASPPESPKAGTEDWITTWPLRGVREIPVVECTRPKSGLLSIRMFDRGTGSTLGAVNVVGESCTSSHAFTSCSLDDASSNVTLRTLITDLKEGAWKIVGCQVFQTGQTTIVTATVNVTLNNKADDTIEGTNGGMTLTVESGCLKMAASILTLMWTLRRQ